MSEGNEPIIIKKGKKCAEGHHGGAWKVAYADFVTAMMALFIVLWILSSSEEIKDNIAGYFQDPFGYTTGGGRSVIEGFGTGMKSPSKTEGLTDEEIRQLEQERLERVGSQIYNQLTESAEFKGVIDQMTFEIVDEGLRIEISETGSAAFFEVGSAKFNPNAERLFKQVGQEIAKLNNKIAIEGHTDARPFPGSRPIYTNFELSSDRALAARRVLELAGVAKDQILEIRGYAANRLRNKSNPFDPINRRISIIVKYSENL